MKSFFLSFILLASSTLIAQESILNGKISNLLNVHDTAFKIVFVKDGKTIDSTLSKVAGFYNARIEAGMYDMLFIKKGFNPIELKNVYMVKGGHTINFSLKFEPLPIQNSVILGNSVHSIYYNSDSISLTDAGALTRKDTKRVVIEKTTESISSYEDVSPAPTALEKTGIRSATSLAVMAGGVSSASKESTEPPEHAGQITAGHWNDNEHWNEWLKTNLQDPVKAAQKEWKMPLTHRLSIQLNGKDGKALAFTKVNLIRKNGETVFESKTDQNGVVYFWPEFKDSISNLNYSISIYGKSYTDVKTYFNSTTSYKTDLTASASALLEIGFVVDATGSMSDEIRYLQAELMDVINRVQKDNKCLTVKTASVFYRDKGDEYLTRITPLSDNPANTLNFIGNQRAGGGGDFPEAVDDAIEDAVNRLEWSDNNNPKIMFLLLDAPPHSKKENLEKLNKYILLAASKGIRIIPITASGINKSTEFLMKNIALVTNGEYIYITDDSHIGNSHIKPTGGESKVEYLNNLMVELINKFSKGNWCNENQTTENTEDNNNNNNNNQEIVGGNGWFMKYFPNPAAQLLNIVFSAEAESIKITDLQGKTIHMAEVKGKEQYSLNISDWKTGLYIIYAINQNETISGKLLVMH